MGRGLPLAFAWHLPAVSTQAGARGPEQLHGGVVARKVGVCTSCELCPGQLVSLAAKQTSGTVSSFASQLLLRTDKPLLYMYAHLFSTLACWSSLRAALAVPLSMEYLFESLLLFFGGLISPLACSFPLLSCCYAVASLAKSYFFAWVSSPHIDLGNMNSG